MSSVKFTGSVQERSTSAAREYVAAVRQRLRHEVERNGAQALESRAYQALERTIASHELRRIWPHADLDEALGE